jgi:hypothetical protein
MQENYFLVAANPHGLRVNGGFMSAVREQRE